MIRKALLTIAAVTALAATSGVLEAAIRHCDGYYYIVATLVDGVPPQRQTVWHMGGFVADGSCGRTVPSRCRQRARDKLRRCYNDHWDTRWDRRQPVTCTRSYGVREYAIQDLKTALEKKVCCTDFGKEHRNITVALYGGTLGGPGCGTDSRVFRFDGEEFHKKRLVAPEYKLDCRSVRRNSCP